MFLEDELGLAEGKDFLVFDDIHGVPEAIAPRGRQLFVTGSLFGISSTKNLLVEFVEMLRDKNPDLVCLSFAADPLPGPFDGTISKGSDVHESMPAGFKGFLEGRIHRTAPRTNAAPFSESHYTAVLKPFKRTLDVIDAIDREFERGRKSA